MRFGISLFFIFIFNLLSFQSKAFSDTATVSQKQLLKLARDYTDQGFYDQAETSYKLYLTNDTANTEVLYELGMLQFTYLFK